MQKFLDRTFVEINFSALENNLNLIKKIVRSTKKDVICVVKANAYGHGVEIVCPILQDLGVLFFAVATIEEGVYLRKCKIKGKILVLGYFSPLEIETAIFYDLTLSVFSVECLNLLLNSNKKVKCQLQIDSGMNRLGLKLLDVEKHKKDILKLYSTCSLDGIFTHFATVNDTAFFEQIKIFNDAKSILNLDFEFCHAENTLATLSQALKDNVNFVRVGLGLYGLTKNASFFQKDGGFLPVLSWRARVAKVFDIKKGESVSYDRTFIANKNMKIATVCLGYGDGLSRALSNNGHMLIRGKKAKIVGRVCMDYCMLDVTEIDGITSCENIATIIGKDGKIEQNSNGLASNLNTISYEIVTKISSRVKRYLV